MINHNKNHKMSKTNQSQLHKKSKMLIVKINLIYPLKIMEISF